MRSSSLKAPHWAVLLAVLIYITAAQTLHAAGSKAVINSDLVLVINGQKVFPIGFTMPPPPNGKTPEGKNGIAELAEAGATFLRTGGKWTPENLQREQKYLDTAARYGLHCLPFLRELGSVSSPAQETELRQFIRRFKNHPGLGAWKGEDEPEWGKRPIPPLVRAYQAIKEEDPNHPVVLIEAPRGTVESMRAYNPACDVVGADIYPIGYPPGEHSLLPNRNISLVGDHTRIMMEVAEGKKPVWMVLQISWSGVLKPGRTLRFPTFAEERFMTYEAIITGARGLIYFGGDNRGSLSPADEKLGWNWTFWKKVLRPVIEEIGSKSRLYAALVAPNSALAIKVTLLTPALSPSEGEKEKTGVEFCARETGDELFILACKREGTTAKMEFSGLPPSAGKGEVMFESPRQVEARSVKFTDWFGPF